MLEEEQKSAGIGTRSRCVNLGANAPDLHTVAGHFMFPLVNTSVDVVRVVVARLGPPQEQVAEEFQRVLSLAVSRDLVRVLRAVPERDLHGPRRENPPDTDAQVSQAL